MASESKTIILIATDDESILTTAKTKLSKDKFELKFADNFSDAVEFLEAKYSFNGVFIDPSLGEAGLKLVRHSHQNQTSVPIYLIGAKLVELAKEITSEQIGVQGFLKTKEEFEEMANIIDHKLKQFDIQKTIKEGKELAKNEPENFEDYIAIRAANFLSGSTCLFDVFVKIRDDKFVKLLNIGEEFEPERLNKYLSKGLEFLYIRKGAENLYINFCDQLTKRILSSKQISSEVKISQTFGHGEQVISALKGQGINEESILFAKSYAGNIHTLLENISQESGAVKALMKNAALYDHCASTAMLACIMGKKFGLDAIESVETLGLACTLHDIGLYQIQNPYDEKEEYKYLDEQFIQDELKKEGLAQKRKKELQRIYNFHPEIGADLVADLPGVKEVVPQIIRQHHLRIDSSGLGAPVKASDFNPLAQILAIADEYSRLLLQISKYKIKEEEIANFPEKLTGYSRPIQRLFHESFFQDL